MSRLREAFRRVLARLQGTVQPARDEDVPGRPSGAGDIEHELDRLVDRYSKIQILPPQGVAAHIRSMRGIECVKLGEHQKAEQLFLEAIELWPGCTDAYRNLAALYTERGDYDRAEEFLKKEQLAERTAPWHVLKPEKRAEFREKFRDSVARTKEREVASTEEGDASTASPHTDSP